MSHNIVPFEFNGVSLTVIADANGEPEFEANALCELLGYSNSRDAITRHCKQEDVVKRDTLTAGGKQRKNFIKERSMWRLVMKANTEGAEKAQDFIAGEVMPSIRKTGSYTKVSPASTAITDPTKVFPGYFRIARMIGCDKNAAAISANNATFQLTGSNVLKLLGHTHLETEDQKLYFNVSDLMDGVSGQRMNKLLESAGLLSKQGDKWVPTKDGMDFCRIFDTGKSHSNGTPVQQIKWSREVLDLLTLGEAA